MYDVTEHVSYNFVENGFGDGEGGGTEYAILSGMVLVGIRRLRLHITSCLVGPAYTFPYCIGLVIVGYVVATDECTARRRRCIRRRRRLAKLTKLL